MTPIESMLVGIALGFMGVGLPTIRTIKTMEGHYIAVFFICLVSSLNLFAFTHLVIAKNFFFMGANMFGAALSVSVIAYRRRNERERKEKLTNEA
jgi:hypothetical protein